MAFIMTDETGQMLLVTSCWSESDIRTYAEKMGVYLNDEQVATVLKRLCEVAIKNSYHKLDWALVVQMIDHVKAEQTTVLSDDDILELADLYLYSGKNYEIIEFARAIESKLKEQ